MLHHKNRFVNVFFWIELMNIFMILMTYSFFLFFSFHNYVVFAGLMVSGLVIFAMGAFFRVNSGFYSQGKMITDPQRRINHYFDKYFVSDVISFFSIIINLIYYTEEGSIRYVGMLVFFKSVTFYRMVKEKEEILNFNGSSVNKI